MKGKSTQEDVLPHSEVGKNTLMFYVLGQQPRSLLWRRRCINTPEQFYKVVLKNNNAQQQRR